MAPLLVGGGQARELAPPTQTSPPVHARLPPGTSQEPPPAAPDVHRDASRPASRIDRLEAWLAAVDRHEPGTADEAAVMVRSWTREELQELATDQAVVATLIEDPERPVQWLVDPARPGRPERAPYSTGDARRLRAMARDVAERCARDRIREQGAIPHAEEAEHCARNRMLKRGAVLHTDAGMLVEPEAVPPQGGGDRSTSVGVRFSDGQPLGREDPSGHWELAQALLDGVTPDPVEDETVRLWYIATSAYRQYHQRLDTHHDDRAVQLFPEDPHVLLLAGSLRETFASPRIQSLARSIRLPAGVSLAIGSPQSELGKAEALLERLEREDQAALVTFSHDVTLHEGLRRDVDRLGRALAHIEPRGETALIDGSYAAMMLGETSVGRDLLIVFSDGVDTSSWLTGGQVLDAARRSDVVVYGVVVRGTDRPEFLRELSELTGGTLLEVDSTRDLDATFVRILHEFRQRYVVSYSPRGVSREGWHELEVTVKGRRATVKARAGYAAGR